MPMADRIIRAGAVTSNEARKRQASYRDRMVKAGMVQVTGWVHSHQQADAVQLLRRLREDESLIPGSLRSTDTNRFVSLESGDE
jgi:hypothetical protein